MTLLSDLMDPWALLGMIEEGYVRQRPHPLDTGLVILNYTEKAQYDKVWNDITRQCRGLIVQAQPDGEALVVARPWPKFFNYGEHDPADLDFDETVVVQDKMDGSLGILYCDPEAQWSISTRGSFWSDQAIHATDLYRERYEDYWAPKPGFTYLFEIIYPKNRIVLDYGDRDDLFLLDILETDTGTSVLLLGEDHGWPGPKTALLRPGTLYEALGTPPRRNAEGMVVTYGSGLKVKIKQEDYVRLHKLVTGLNERAVWEHLAGGGSLPALVAEIPDEFHEWVTIVAEEFWDRFDTVQGRAHEAYHRIVADMLGLDTDRKWFAERAKAEGDLTPLLFQMLDGRDISAAIWKTLRPVGETKSLMNRTEDTA
jgi:RNA ligase